jgi:hypothetical protein
MAATRSGLDELLDLEHEGWQVLATGAQSAARFFGRVLAPDALFVLPGDVVLVGREAIIEALSGPPWTSFVLSDERVVELGEGAAMVAYRAHARRDDVVRVMRMTSTYVRGTDGWVLRVHQQTLA